MKKTLVHGGQLSKIAKQYDIPVEDWLDLSTGISPLSYPVGQLPERIWQRLPEESSDLITAAQQYYQCQHILPISGSQAVIQLLPKLLSAQVTSEQPISAQGKSIGKVYLPKVGYQEHRKAWVNHNCDIKNYQHISDIQNITKGDVVVLINPNNPTGELYLPKVLQGLFNQVKLAEALLIIDEAFMDCTPEYSFIQNSADPSLIVLRSAGKFFGLAGLRLGFVAAAPCWLERLTYLLGPWSVNGPAQYIGQQALSDLSWQENQRRTLQSLSDQLAILLMKYFKVEPKGTLLFKTIQHNNAPNIFEALCQQGVYVRLCDEQNALRFGIPKKEELNELEDALKVITTF